MRDASKVVIRKSTAGSGNRSFKEKLSEKLVTKPNQKAFQDTVFLPVKLGHI